VTLNIDRALFHRLNLYIDAQLSLVYGPAGPALGDAATRDRLRARWRSKTLRWLLVRGLDGVLARRRSRAAQATAIRKGLTRRSRHL
jgi:hypothetical protein